MWKLKYVEMDGESEIDFRQKQQAINFIRQRALELNLHLTSTPDGNTMMAISDEIKIYLTKEK